MDLRRLLSVDTVHLLEKQNKVEAIERLVETVDPQRHALSHAEILDRLLAREELMSTGIGLGLGVPHIRAAGIGEPVVRVGICREGIPDYEAIDGEPVKLLFMILLKEDQQRDHVRLLAEIVALMKRPGLRESLFAAASAEQAWQLLDRALEGNNASV